MAHQESIISLYKENNSLKGILQSNIILQNEDYLMNAKIELPEIDVNYDIGNFEVEVIFEYQNNRKVRMRNLGMLKYYSFFVRIFRSIVRMPMIVFGLLDEAQVVKVDFHNALQGSSEIQKVFINITPPELRVYSVTMNFEVKLKGIKKIMHDYFFISFGIGTFLIFFTLVLMFSILFSLKYKTTENFKKNCKKHEKNPKLKDSKHKKLSETPKTEPFDFSSMIIPSNPSRYSKIFRKLIISL